MIQVIIWKLFPLIIAYCLYILSSSYESVPFLSAIIWAALVGWYSTNRIMKKDAIRTILSFGFYFIVLSFADKWFSGYYFI